MRRTGHLVPSRSTLDFEIYLDKFAPSAQAVFRQAYEDAKQLGQTQMNDEDVLKAFAQTEGSFLDELLKRLNLDRQAMLQKLSDSSVQSKRYGGMKISEGLRKVMRHALETARDRGRHHIESIDLLIGVFRDEDNLSVKAFEEFGADREDVIQTIRELATEYNGVNW
jgi:ATP-dependent Clp protease ATP-binding subunit ClpA